ncbi:hypothetical protein HZA97_07185 [Candidatus Woesearchaeota archaeon]|nr:hypothetical protein [Candidatus Woesearchaeota archaeon]
MYADIIKFTTLKELVKPSSMKISQQYIYELNNEVLRLIDKSISRAKHSSRRKLLARDV